MKKEILKIAGVKSEKEFYKKFPDEASFMKKHGKAFKKAQIGAYIGGDKDMGFQPTSFKDVYDEADYTITGSTEDIRSEEARRNMEAAAAQKAAQGGGGLGNIGSMLMQAGETFAESGAFAKKGKKIKKAQFGTNAFVDPSTGLVESSTGRVSMADAEMLGFGSSDTDIDVKQGDWMKQIGKYAGPAGQLLQGFQQLRDEKRALQRAEQMKAVSDLSLQAARTRPEETQRRYVRPEDVVNTGEEFFPTFGVGTNPLGQARDGKMIGGIPGEISNTFAPNTIYDDLGYEPLNDSQRYKQFMYGGKMQKAQTGLEAFAQAGGGDLASNLITGIGGENAGGNIGGTIGKAAGQAIGGPVGGMIGQVGGQLIGMALDRKPQKIKKAKEATQRNVQSMALQQGLQGGQAQYTSFMKDGGQTSPYAWISHTWQPQKITKFGNYDVKDLLRPPHDADMLRAGGHLKAYTPPSERAMSTERPMMQMGGELQTHWGGYAEPMSYNPYLPEDGETIMFRGQSHDESDGKGNTGIGITFGDNPVEVERGEPAVKLKDGTSGDNSLVVYGNLSTDKFTSILGEEAKGKKFKTFVADLSKKEAKQNKLIDKSTDELDNLEVSTPIDKIKLNSLQHNMMGANSKLKDIAEKKITAASLQSAINDTAAEMGVVADDLAKGKVKIDKKAAKEQAKYGKAIDKAQSGYKSKYGLEPWTGDKNSGIKNASAYNAKEWDEIAESLGFDKTGKRGNRAFQEFLFENEDLRNAIINNHQRLYKSDPTSTSRNWYDDKLGAGWAAPELKPKAPQTPSTTSTFTTIPLGSKPKGKTTDTQTTKYDVAEYKRSGLVDVLGQILPYVRPSDVEDLDTRQLSGEMYALATNQLEPVAAQTIQPQLNIPYDISLQDILNENEASFRSQQRLMGYNPAAQSQLAAQKYAANQKVLGEQFRMNQAMKNQVYAENRNLLNQFGLKNLEILDRQYVRQAEAKSKTKAVTQAAINSISDKYLRNQLENRTLATMENLYNYRFDPRFRAINVNAPYQPVVPTVYQGTTVQKVPVLDDKGNILYYEQKTVDPGTESSEKATTAKNGTKTDKKKKMNSSIVKAFRNL